MLRRGTHVSISKGQSQGPLGPCRRWATYGEEEQGRAVCRHLGMSLQPQAAASVCAAISRPAGLKLSCAWALGRQHKGVLSPFTRGGLQSCRCHARGSRVLPDPCRRSWMRHPGGLDLASLSAAFARRRPWPSLGLVTGCLERREQRSAQHVAARFVHPQPFNYVPFPLVL